MNNSFLSTDEHYRLLVENLTDYAIIALDTNGTIMSWNKGAQQLLQYTEKEALGKNASIFFTDNDLAKGAFEKEKLQAIEEGRGEDERWHVRKDGTTFWGSGILCPVYDTNHMLVGFAKIFRDRTERMSHERRKDEFVGIAGHELRTPLSIIRMSLELLILQTEKKDPTMARELRSMNEHIDRLAHIITDLLDLSRIASGQLTLNRTHFDLCQLLRDEVLPYYRSIAKNHTITLLQSDEAEVFADKDHIIQVVYNLISNAIKYSPKADRVELAVLHTGHAAKMTVRDYGMGIPTEEHNRIFQRFYRINNKRQTATGLGVGLYVCLELIKAHGGTMGVDKTTGPGATMYFTLPLQAGAPA